MTPHPTRGAPPGRYLSGVKTPDPDPDDEEEDLWRDAYGAYGFSRQDTQEHGSGMSGYGAQGFGALGPVARRRRQGGAHDRPGLHLRDLRV